MTIKNNFLRKAIALLILPALLVGLVPAVNASEQYPLPAKNEESLARLYANLKNDMVGYDSEIIRPGTSEVHMQGICVDDAYKYLYISYTEVINKVDLATGETVGRLGGFKLTGGKGKPHLGCMAYYDGRIYCSTGYKQDAVNKYFVIAIDEDAFPMDGSYKDVEPFLNPDRTQVPDGEKDNYHAFFMADVVEGKRSGLYRAAGMDGICFGAYPGDTSGDTYMLVSQSSARGLTYYDNDYCVITAYKLENFIGDTKVDIPLTTDRIKNTEYTQDERLTSDKRLFVHTGNVYASVQNMDYDKDTGDLVLITYEPTKTWNLYLNGVLGKESKPKKYVIDGSKTPVYKTLELGQSNNDRDPDVKQAAIDRVENFYKANNNGEIPKGDHAVLKCICGLGSMDNHECISTYVESTGVDAGLTDLKLCFREIDDREDYGLASLGDGYYYATWDSTKVRLYKSNENYKFTKVNPPAPELEELVHLKMNAEDLYVDETGTLRMRNALDNGYDAIVQGTSAAEDQNDVAGSATYFSGFTHPTNPDRIYLDEATMDYFNQKTKKRGYSFSFWAKMAMPKNRAGRAIPVAGFYREDKTYGGVFELQKRQIVEYKINGLGEDTAGSISKDYGPPIYRTSKQTDGKIGDDAWHHFVVTELDGYSYIYLDGVPGLVKDSTNTDTTVFKYDLYKDRAHMKNKPFQYFEIGGSLYNIHQDSELRGRLTGAVDDVRIFAGILTAEDVANMYAAGVSAASDTEAAYPVTATDETNSVFTPAYPVYNRSTDGGEELTVTATKAVQSVRDLFVGTDYTVSGNSITFAKEYLAGKSRGIHELLVTFADNTTETLHLTVVEDGVAVLDYKLNRDSISGKTVTDSSAYGVNAVSSVALTTYGENQKAESDGAVSFDGFDYANPQYIYLAKDNAQWLNAVLKDGYTVNFWANAGFENGNKMALLGLYNQSGRPLGAVEEYDKDSATSGTATLMKDGKMTIRADVGNGRYREESINATATEQVNTKEWVMYTMTFADGKLSLYVSAKDTVRKCYTKEVSANVLGEIAHFIIGANYNRYYKADSWTDDYEGRGGFCGLMSDVSVYPNAMNTAAIERLYQGGREFIIIPTVSGTNTVDVAFSAAPEEKGTLLVALYEENQMIAIKVLPTDCVHATYRVELDKEIGSGQQIKVFALKGIRTLNPGSNCVVINV
ncbi:MAG: hypothetical protein IJN25_04375 [Clostridia bacterium]|nr:hypothetical protein [Clostridia bacterium]